MKTCTKCLKDQSTGNFHRRSASTDGFQAICKLCAKHRAHKYYLSTPEQTDRRMASNQRMKDLAREFIIEYLSTHHCVDCGNSNPVVLEFDHVRGKKEFQLAKGISSGYSVTRLLSEIAKCDVRCSNCHTIVTAERAGWHWVTRVDN